MLPAYPEDAVIQPEAGFALGTPGLSWTLRCGPDFTVSATYITHKTPSLGYVVRESDRAGKLLVERCAALGVPQNGAYGQLKAGMPVTLEDGTVVTPEQASAPGASPAAAAPRILFGRFPFVCLCACACLLVASSEPSHKSPQVLMPDVKGRKVTLLGDTCDPRAIAGLAYGSDLLVHESTFEGSRQQEATSKVCLGRLTRALALPALAVPLPWCAASFYCASIPADHPALLLVWQGHSTAVMAAQFAQAVAAKVLIISHFSARYTEIHPKAAVERRDQIEQT